MPMEEKEQTSALQLPQEWKRELRRLPWLLLIPFGVILPTYLSRFPDTVERLYCHGLYPLLSGIIQTLTGFFPFSLAEWILYTLVIGVPVLIFLSFTRVLLRRIRWSRFVHLLLTLLIIAGIMLNAFYVLWGLNYSRATLGSQLSLDVRERSVEELEGMCFSLAQQAVVLRERVQEDDRGVFTLPDGISACLRRIPSAYQRLSQFLPQFSGKAARPKQVFASKGMSWGGISGIYIPFTAEPNVNTDQPVLLIPSSAAHESAHSMGIAREDEANFAAYLACMASNDPALEYSGVMLALIHSGNELYRESPKKYAALYSSYSAGMLRDLMDYDAYWDKFEGPVEKTVNKVNDGYLKYNRQAEGVKSYGEMVDLLLAWYEKQI